LAGILCDGGCSLPEYKLLVSNIPGSSTLIEAAVYLPDSSTLLTEQVSAVIPTDKAQLTVSVNLKGAYDQPARAVFGVVSRDAAGCITASGTTVPVAPSSSVADVPVRMTPLLSPSAATERCRAKPPILVDVQREERGYFGKTDFQLQLSGWGFSPTDKVTVKSQLLLPKTSCLSKCSARCPEVRPCTSPSTGAMCQTGCTLVGTMEYVGPGLLLVHLPEQLPVEEPPPPPPMMALSNLYISGAQLVGNSMIVTVSSADSSSVTTFAEPRPAN
jgi:hypothetical protein